MGDIGVEVALSIRAAQSEGTTEPAVLRPVPHLGDQADLGPQRLSRGRC